MLGRLAVLVLAVGVAFGGLCGLIVYRGGVDDTSPAEAILVLGAAVFEGGKPSPVLEARVAHAVGLYRRGLAPQMVLTSGVGARPPSEAEVTARLATAAGVLCHALVLETRAHTTQQSVQFMAALLEERDVQSIIVVSSPFHLFRATWMVRNAGFVAYSSGPRDGPLWAHPVVGWKYILRETCCFVLHLLLGM